MVIKTPNSDEIFRKWIDNLDKKTLEKYFKQKKIPLERKNIAAADFVRKSEKYILFYVEAKVEAKKKNKKVRIPPFKLKKVEFYDYPTNKEVPIYKTMKQVKCDKCKGLGYFKCKSCGGLGHVKCSKCGGSGTITCPECKGKGYIEVEIKVYTSEKEKKKEIIRIPCPTCHGQKKIICPDCGGTGRVICPECKGSGGVPCKNCDSTGILIEYEVGPILYPEMVEKYIITPEDIKSNVEKEILENIEKAEGLRISSEKYLDEKNLAQQLGFMTDYTKKTLSKLKKKIKEIQKSKVKQLKLPLKGFPVIQLVVDAPNKKGIIVLGIGSKEKFITTHIA